MSMRSAWGVGLATIAADGTTLDVWYPAPALGEPPAARDGDPGAVGGPRRRAGRPGGRGRGARGPPRGRAHRRRPRRRRRPTPPTPTCACTCCRTASSRRTGRTSTASSACCANVVWTDRGPCAVDGLRGDPAAPARGDRRAGHRARRRQVPADGRLRGPGGRPHRRRRPRAARRAPGRRARPSCTRASSTSTPGTLGASMVEGRISAGVVVGDGSDVGGGASIMGTLSGGGREVISDRPSAACWARTPGSASRSATTASSRPASTSPPAPRSRSWASPGRRRPRGRPGRQGARAVRGRRHAVPAQLAAPAASRRSRAPAHGVGLNAALHAN